MRDATGAATFGPPTQRQRADIASLRLAQCSLRVARARRLTVAGRRRRPPSRAPGHAARCTVESSMMASRAYREKLIEEVKKYPVLYDTRHESHRDIDARDQCWMKIATKLSINSEVLKREWKILRDSMRQALKRSKSTTTRAGLPCKKWRFENKMAFLLPYMTVRRNQRHFKEDIKIDDIAEQSEQESEIWDPGNNADQDSLDLFFASVCQSTKRLPKKFQSQIKRQVLEVLLRTEEELENELSETKAELNKNF